MIDLVQNNTSTSGNVITGLTNFNSIPKDSISTQSNDDKFASLIALSDKNLQRLKGKFKEEDVSLNTPFEEVPFENFKSYINGLLSAGDLNNINQNISLDNNSNPNFQFLADDMVKNIDQLENIKQKINDNISSTISGIDNFSLEDLKTLVENSKGFNINSLVSLDDKKLSLSNKTKNAIETLDKLATSDIANNVTIQPNVISNQANINTEISNKNAITTKKDLIADIVKYKDAYIKIEKNTKQVNTENSTPQNFTSDGLKLNNFLINQNIKIKDINSSVDNIDNVAELVQDKPVNQNLTSDGLKINNALSNNENNLSKIISLPNKTDTKNIQFEPAVNIATQNLTSDGLKINNTLSNKENNVAKTISTQNSVINNNISNSADNKNIQFEPAVNIATQNLTSDGLNINNNSVKQSVISDNYIYGNKFIFNDTSSELIAQHFESQKETNLESNSQGKSGNSFDFSKPEQMIEDNILKSQAEVIGQSKFKTEFFKAEMKEVAPRTFANVNPNEINAPIVKTINDMHGDGSTVANLILNPANLGTVRIEIAVKDNVAKIKINAESADVAKTIEAQLPALKDKLAENGIKTDSFDLNYNNKQSEGSDSFAQNQHNAKQEEGEVRKRYLEFMKRLGELENSFSEKFGYEPELTKTNL